jgi:hypothetical protein
MPTPEDRERARAELVQDLARVRDFLAKVTSVGAHAG